MWTIVAVLAWATAGPASPASPAGPELPAACGFPAVLGGAGSNAGQMLPAAGLEPPGIAATQASEAYLAAAKAWRANCTAALRYNASIYQTPALAWTQSSYIQPQIHP